MAMAVDSLKVIFLTADIEYALKHGGLTAQERSALAKRFRVSEAVLLRFERATYAFNSLFEKQWRQGRLEAMRRMNQLGKELVSPELGEETSKALHRIQDAASENDITREYREAAAALQAAFGVATSTPEE